MKAFSAVGGPFISDVFPHKKDRVTVRIAFSEEPMSVTLCSDSEGGLIERKPMEAIGRKRNAWWYEGSFPIPDSDDRFTWFYCFRDRDGDAWYYAKNGIRRHSPKIADRFIVTPGVVYPEWIASRTCYQIFPDRFFDGDMSLDYRDGEYRFDGTSVKSRKWGEKPLPFDEGRCLDFYSGDIPGMEQKLPYIRSLGFDTVYMNPINDSRTIHRYDSTDFFHVDPHLGGDEAFESFMKKAHSMDMKVIVDISINHTGVEHPWFLSAKDDPDSPYREFYYFREDGSFRCWAGVPTLPQLNWKSRKLRDLIYRDAESAMQKYLAAPYEIDGWRMDVAPELGRAGDDQLCHEVWRELRTSLKERSPECYITGEAWDDSSEYLHGDEWDGIMNYYGAGRPLRCWMGEEDRFLTAGWGHAPGEIENFSSSEVIEWMEDALITNSDQRAFMQMNLIDSHDTPRLHNHSKIMDDRVYLGTMLALYFLPGMPNTYYGDEVKLDGEMGSVEMSRYPMEWDEEKQDREYMEWWKEMGRIRKMEGFALASTSFSEVSPECFIIYRHADDGTVYAAVINRSPEGTRVRFDPFLLGDGMTVLIGEGRITGDMELDLPPFGSVAVLFR